jgi:hypothetical protein
VNEKVAFVHGRQYTQRLNAECPVPHTTCWHSLDNDENARNPHLAPLEKFRLQSVPLWEDNPARSRLPHAVHF